jgi:hypothetical protein
VANVLHAGDKVWNAAQADAAAQTKSDQVSETTNFVVDGGNTSGIAVGADNWCCGGTESTNGHAVVIVGDCNGDRAHLGDLRLLAIWLHSGLGHRLAMNRCRRGNASGSHLAGNASRAHLTRDLTWELLAGNLLAGNTSRERLTSVLGIQRLRLGVHVLRRRSARVLRRHLSSVLGLAGLLLNRLLRHCEWVLVYVLSPGRRRVDRIIR